MLLPCSSIDKESGIFSPTNKKGLLLVCLDLIYIHHKSVAALSPSPAPGLGDGVKINPKRLIDVQ